VNIPIVALDESVKVRIVLNQSTVFMSGSYNGRVQADLFVDYVYVSKAERDYMTLYPLTYMTQTFQLVRFRLPASFYQSTYSLLTRFVNSVAELYWVVQSDSASNVYDYTNSGTDHLVSLRLASDTVDIITPDYASALYLRAIQGLEFHTRVPDSQFYMYSFGIAPELDTPSGTLNFSSLENQQHELTLTPCIVGRDVRIYARSYNVFHISGGEGRVVFPTQEAGPVDGTIKGVTTSQLISAPGNAVFSLYYGGTGGTGNYGASGSAVDSFGNTYSCGTFGTSTLVVYNKDGSTFGTFNLVTGSTNTGYVVKYNTSGTAVWVTTIGGPGSARANVTGIEVDTYGDLLVSGTTIAAGAQTITLYTNGVTAYVTTTLTTTAGTYDMFLTKLASATGTPLWLVPITGSIAGSEGANARQTSATYQSFLSLGTDLPGNAYLTFTSNSTAVSTSGVSRSSIGGTYNGSVSELYSPNTYLAQFNKSGTFQWIAGIAGNPSGNIFVTSATTTINGLTSVTGYFTSNAFTPFNTAGQTNTGYALTRSDFDSYYGVPAAVTATTVNSYLATYTSTGTIQMLAQYVGSNVQSLSIAQDVSANIVTCGTFVGSTLVFYNSSASSIPPSLIGIGGALFPATGVDTYAFIVKYSVLGYFQWATQIGGTGQTYLTSCTTDATNSVYSCGYTISPTMTIGTRTLARIGTIDGLVVKYSASGAYAWAIQIGASGATVNCRSVAIDPLSQNIVVTGTYTSTVPVVVYTVSGISSGVTLPATSIVQPFVIELKA
jgi:hypothetical protein